MVRCGKNAVSSTSIRGLISKGRFLAAMRRLGRPVAILGTVIHGSSFGKKLGFATANLSPHHEVVPPDGIYAVTLVLEGRQYRGVCYIGTRPTFSADNSRPKERTIEVHIFDFSRMIYGKEIEVSFAGKIRDDRRFASSDLLIKQIKKDIAKARNMLSSRHSHHNLCCQGKLHY
jgi:riboflavin kinase/FMN adenylyltransferase